jgi:hypothetical protein
MADDAPGGILMFNAWMADKMSARDYCVLYKCMCRPSPSIRGCVACYERYVAANVSGRDEG